jgi:Rrf2 family protein
MLSMTRKSGYALIAMTHLTKLSDDELASARGIAEEYKIPQALLMNVMKELSAAGFLESVRGARGGYQLARPAEEISILELLETIEGPVRLANCMTEEGPDLDNCELLSNCPIATPIHRLHGMMRSYLSRLTLQNLVDSASTDADADAALMLNDA